MEKSTPWLTYKNQAFAAVAASLSFFVAGEVRGWASPAVPSLQGLDNMNQSLSYAPLTKEEASWITSGPPIGAIPSALVASFLLQWLGRKKTIMLALSIFVVTFSVMGTASIHESYAAILVCRSLTGVAVGFCMPAAQIYVSECSTPSIRGFLGSLPAMFMAIGISATYFAGAFLPWYILSYSCALVPFLGLLALCFIPESPVWLNMKGKANEALNAAVWLRNEQVIDSIVKPPNSSEKSEMGNNSPWTRKTMVPFAISMALMVFQQWSGVNTVIFNTVTIFSAARISMDEHLASNIVGIVQVLATAMSIVVVDKAGRRVLLIASGIVMTLSLSIIGAYFYVIYEIDPIYEEQMSWLPLASLILFMIGYSLGFATIPFLLMGELLSSQYRNTLGGIASSFNLLHTFLVLKLFSNMETQLGYYGVFWIYASNCFIGSAFVYLVLPETRGKTLLEIEKHFAQ